MCKRIFDIIFSLILIFILIPFFLIISILILIDSKGGVIFKQIRVGKNGKLFTLYKFRSMYINKENNSLLTVGNDKRITRVGKVLRKTKLDELPQLFNILKGDMSFVGPRPEVPEYVKYYTEEQRKVLSIRPGLTDYASLYFINEAEILANAQNPEEYYIKEIIPKKISLSLKYVEKPTIWNDFVILAKTFFKILRLN